MWPGEARAPQARLPTVRSTAHCRCAISATAQHPRAVVARLGSFAEPEQRAPVVIQLDRTSHSASARRLLKTSASIDGTQITRSCGTANLHGLSGARADDGVQLHADQCITRLAAFEPPGPPGREADLGMALPGLLERL